jgi:hypothetical protein
MKNARANSARMIRDKRKILAGVRSSPEGLFRGF